MSFNEDTRVKIPAIITLTRLGYNYLSKDRTDIDIETNIFKDIFFESLKKINKDIKQEELESILNKIKLELSNDDLGRQFYNRLTNQTNIKLIDFNNIENNTLNVVTELTCKNEDEEFRPDITLLINGMPLYFIEVKKPNNKEGIEVEMERINKRFKNEKL